MLCLLSVARNDLQPQGCRILLGALSFHKTLTALDISDNMLNLFNDKQGYLALTYLLQYSKHLCWLSICDNPLPSAAATALTESLSPNHSLTSLYASRCGISRENGSILVGEMILLGRRSPADLEDFSTRWRVNLPMD